MIRVIASGCRLASLFLRKATFRKRDRNRFRDESRLSPCVAVRGARMGENTKRRCATFNLRKNIYIDVYVCRLCVYIMYKKVYVCVRIRCRERGRERESAREYGSAGGDLLCTRKREVNVW